MSSDGDASAIATVVQFIYTELYCDLAASVLFFHDASLTFDREVACFWTTKWTAASLLYLANKWISMALYVMQVVQLVPFPSDKAAFAFVVLQFILGAVFSALRAYVLSRSKVLGVAVLALSLAPVGANLVHFGYDLSGAISPPFGCLETGSTTQIINLRLTVISRVPLIVADTSLVYLTWSKLARGDALRVIRQSKRLSLSDVLLRNGTIYFVVLSALNILHLVLSVSASLGSNGTGASSVTTFTAPLTAILVSRFLLELQEANRATIRVDHEDPLQSSRDPYDSAPTFISSLGAFVNPDVTESRHDEPEWHADSCSVGEEVSAKMQA